MKRIIHISDLHFGSENDQVVTTLLKSIHSYKPDVVVISGDLTQRARKKQFKAAAAFIDKISFPIVVVPGNHDVPLYDITRRFMAPFNRYIRYINSDFYPFYRDDPICVLGINTAYSFTWQSGRVTSLQLQNLRDKFQLAGLAIKILVIHHPVHEIFCKPYHYDFLEELGIDLILSGHAHRASVKTLNDHITTVNLQTIIVQAGTAVSTRLRNESNSYNEIEVHDRDNITIIIKEHVNSQFKERHRYQFRRQDHSWLLIS